MGNGQNSSKNVTRIINVPIVQKDQVGKMAQSLFISHTQKLNVLDPYEQLSLNYTGIKNNFFSQKKIDQSSNLQINVVHGLVGLENLGNTCYFNTAIHCLSHTQPLLDYFLSRLYEKELNTKNPNGTKGEVTQSFANLLLDIWKDTRCVGINEDDAKPSDLKYEQNDSQKLQFINPSYLIAKVQKHSKRFEVGYQEDGQELLAFLLDMIHEDVNRVKTFNKDIDLEFHDDQCNESQAAQSWERHLKSNKSIIVDLFHGQMKSSLQCLKCSSWSHKFEPFLFLSVPLQSQELLEKSVSTRSNSASGKYSVLNYQQLNDCLRQFSQKEKLSGDCQWFCHKCKKNQDASKQLQLWKLPNVLIIHLKRFEFQSGSKLGKITTKVEFPIDELDMSEFVVSEQKEKPIYTLYAVAQHQGTLYNGHYTAVCRNRKDDKWYYYNDDQVCQVANVQQVIVNQYAYVLFYQKSSSDEIFRQTLSNPEKWPHQLKQQKQEPLNLLITESLQNEEMQQGHLDLSSELEDQMQGNYQFSQKSFNVIPQSRTLNKKKVKDLRNDETIFHIDINDNIADLSNIKGVPPTNFEISTRKLNEKMSQTQIKKNKGTN